MDPSAKAFVPRASCLFYAQGICRYGVFCRNLHVDSPSKPPEPGITPEEEEVLEAKFKKSQKQERDDSTTCVRDIYGSVVTFGAGAAVTEINLPTTFEYGKWVQTNVVLCTWFRPAKMAFLTFADPGARNEAAELLLKTATPSGRILSCKIRQPRLNDSPNRFSLEVRNLDLDCGEEWLEDVLASNCLLRVKLKEPISDALPDEARGVVEGLLQSIGPINNCVFSDDSKRMKLRLTASFDHETSASKAIKELNGTDHEDIGRLNVQRIISVKFNVPTKIASALFCDFQKLQKQSRVEYRVQLNLPPSINTNKPSQSLRIASTGEDSPKMVAKVKVELEKLLQGTVINGADAPLWHSLFGVSDGLKYLTSVSHANQLYIHVDVRKSLLLFYGGTPLRREDARRALLSKVTDLNEDRQKWVLAPEDFNTALTGGGFARLQEVYNNKVRFDVTSIPKAIVLQGTRKDLQIAKSIFHAEEFWYESDDANPPTLPAGSPDDCCLCMTDPDSEDIVKTPCNHIYCRTCFLHQVGSVSENEIPLRCHAHGEEGRCPHVFSLQELRTLLEFATFEALLEASFKIYIRTHPTEFQYCPTPDCQSIYSVRSDAVPVTAATQPVEPIDPETSTFFCIACLSTICTKCKTVSHEGMTCAEYQDSLNLEANHDFMRENGIKECPRCATPIEKDGGCNHMTCAGCHAHICWNCLASFEEPGACYEHLTEVHGGNGLHEQEFDLDDPFRLNLPNGTCNTWPI